MTKRKITKKTAEVKPSPKPRDPCIVKGCKNITAYMKRNRKTQVMEHWCVKHWKRDVEGKNPERYRSSETVSARRAREAAATKPKRRVRKSAEKSRRKRVVRRVKK